MLSTPDRPMVHSEKKEEGDGSKPSATNLDGNADIGVSMLLLLLYELLFACDGGCGRANGLGGPDAPALKIALALGDGGGRTTPVPEEWLASVLAFLGVAPD